MKPMELNEEGKCFCSEESFFAYLRESAMEGDFTEEEDGTVYYFNENGDLLEEYNRTEGYGKLY